MEPAKRPPSIGENATERDHEHERGVNEGKAVIGKNVVPEQVQHLRKCGKHGDDHQGLNDLTDEQHLAPDPTRSLDVIHHIRDVNLQIGEEYRTRQQRPCAVNGDGTVGELHRGGSCHAGQDVQANINAFCDVVRRGRGGDGVSRGCGQRNHLLIYETNVKRIIKLYHPNYYTSI